MLARKSPLARFARTASSLACRSSASMRLRSSISSRRSWLASSSDATFSEFSQVRSWAITVSRTRHMMDASACNILTAISGRGAITGQGNSFNSTSSQSALTPATMSHGQRPSSRKKRVIGVMLRTIIRTWISVPVPVCAAMAATTMANTKIMGRRMRRGGRAPRRCARRPNAMWIIGTSSASPMDTHAIFGSPIATKITRRILNLGNMSRTSA